MITNRVFYSDHADRYPQLSSMERNEYPDEVFVFSWGIIKREKNIDDMTKEDWQRYGPTFIRLAAKDIPVREGMKE